MNSTQKVELISGSTTFVNLVSPNGSVQLVSLAQVASRVTTAQANLTSQEALVTAIEALGLMLPIAN